MSSKKGEGRIEEIGFKVIEARSIILKIFVHLRLKIITTTVAL